MYDPSEALLQLGLYDYVWGDPTMLNVYNSNVQAQKAREEQARYNMLWKQIEERNAQIKEKESYNKELKEASVEMAKLNKDLINAKPQEAVIIQKQQEALAAKYPELKDSTADAIAARKAEEDYQKAKVGIIGSIPRNFATDKEIDAQVTRIMNDPTLRPEDKEAAIKDLQAKKSTAQLAAEASQSAIASHSGKNTGDKLDFNDVLERSKQSGYVPSSADKELMRKNGYFWDKKLKNYVQGAK